MAPAGRAPLIFSIAIAAPFYAAPQQAHQPVHDPSTSTYLENARKALAAGDFTQARVGLRHVLTLDPGSAEAYLMLGSIDLQEGNIAGAIQADRRAAEVNLRPLVAHYSLALAYLRKRDLERRCAELQHAVEFDPRYPDAASHLGVMLIDLGKPDEAVIRLRQAKALSPMWPDVAFNLVWAELAAHHPDRASAAATQALSHFADDAR